MAADHFMAVDDPVESLHSYKIREPKRCELCRDGTSLGTPQEGIGITTFSKTIGHEQRIGNKASTLRCNWATV